MVLVGFAVLGGYAMHRPILTTLHPTLHSWRALVAVTLALQAPQLVRSLVVASGYYYPTSRADVLLALPVAIPGVGDLMRHAVSPALGRLMQPALIEAMFAPAAVTDRFDCELPKAIMLRPLQLRASSDSADTRAEGSAFAPYQSTVP